MKTLTLLLANFILSMSAIAQVNSANVYWVGHSLISHTYTHDASSENLMNLMSTMTSSQSKTYSYYDHTTPGAPLGWNWGHNNMSWSDGTGTLIQPLINTSHADYGSFDVMVLTEGIDINNTYEYWASSFYARKFFNAAKNANSNTRLFLYESWHHYNASDDVFRPEYGPMASFNWDSYMNDAHDTWNDILEQASDPSLTQNDAGYSFQGTGTDPGISSDVLDIKIIPTGKVLREVLQRLELNLSTDDWSFGTGNLEDIDFFENPLANFPSDLTTTVHAGSELDDIHPSNVLIYLNALVHYAVIYQENPSALPAANGVPENIASIFKEIAWDVVINDNRTGVTGDGSTTSIAENNLTDLVSVYPNPTSNYINFSYDHNESIKIEVSILDIYGRTVSEKIKLEGSSLNQGFDVSHYAAGLYFMITKTDDNQIKRISFTKK